MLTQTWYVSSAHHLKHKLLKNNCYIYMLYQDSLVDIEYKNGETKGEYEIMLYWEISTQKKPYLLNRWLVTKCLYFENDIVNIGSFLTEMVLILTLANSLIYSFVMKTLLCKLVKTQTDEYLDHLIFEDKNFFDLSSNMDWSLDKGYFGMYKPSLLESVKFLQESWRSIRLRKAMLLSIMSMIEVMETM